MTTTIAAAEPEVLVLLRWVTYVEAVCVFFEARDGLIAAVE
jgi:hypothetical protein